MAMNTSSERGRRKQVAEQRALRPVWAAWTASAIVRLLTISTRC